MIIARQGSARLILCAGLIQAGLFLTPAIGTPPTVQLLERSDFESTSGIPTSFGVSADMRYVSYLATPNSTLHYVREIVLYNRQSGQSETVSVTPTGEPSVDNDAPGPGNVQIALSADGRYVAFRSAKTDLVSHDTNMAPDIFIRDRVAGRTMRVMDAKRGQLLGTNGLAGISYDGRKVLYSSQKDVMRDGSFPDYSQPGSPLQWFLVDRVTGKTLPVNRNRSRKYFPIASLGQASMSADGRYVAVSTDARLVAQDLDNESDVYRIDTLTGTAVIVSNLALPPVAATPAGVPKVVDPPFSQQHADYDNPTISANGSIVAFHEQRYATPYKDAKSPSAGGLESLESGEPLGERLVAIDLTSTSRRTKVAFSRTYIPTLLRDPQPLHDAGGGGIRTTVITRDGKSLFFVLPARDGSQIDSDPGTVPNNTATTLYKVSLGNSSAPVAWTSPAACAACPVATSGARDAAVGTIPGAGRLYYGAFGQVISSPDGRRALFITTESLVATDVDDTVDLYLVTS